MPIYMHYDGIKGDVTEEKHKEWIALDSAQLGAGRGISTPTGNAANREASLPSISEITVTKALDGASHTLFKSSVEGSAGKTVKIDFCATDKDARTYLTLTLTNTLISGFSMSSGGDRPSESLSLNFTKIEFKSAPLDPTNKTPKGPFTVAYDLSTAKAS